MRNLTLIIFSLSIFGISEGQSYSNWLKLSSEQQTSSIYLSGSKLIGAKMFSGVAAIDLSNGESQFYDEFNSDIPDDNTIDACIDLNGIIWTTHKYGIGSFDGSTWTKLFPYSVDSPTINPSINVDHQNNKWVSYGKRLLKINDTTSVFYDASDCSSFNGGIGRIEVGPQNNIWVSAGCSGICKFDGVSWSTITGLPYCSIYDFAEDGNGNLWVVNAGHLLKINSLGIQNFNAIPELNGYSKFIEIDSFNNVWVASDYGSNSYNTFTKLFKFDGLQWGSYPTPQVFWKKNGGVYDMIIQDPNDKFFATGKGVVRLTSSGTFQYPTNDTSLLCGKIGTVFPSKNDNSVWISQGTGLSRFINGQWQRFPDTAAAVADKARQYFLDRKDSLWFWNIGNTNISRMQSWSNGVWNTYDIPVSYYYSPPALAFDTLNNIWIGASTQPPGVPTPLKYYDGILHTFSDSVFNSSVNFFVDDCNNLVTTVGNTKIGVFSNGLWSYRYPISANLCPTLDFRTTYNSCDYYFCSIDTVSLIGGNTYNAIADSTNGISLIKLEKDIDGSFWGIPYSAPCQSIYPWTRSFLYHYVNGSWDSLFIPEIDVKNSEVVISDLAIDHQGNKWIVCQTRTIVPAGSFLYIFNENGINAVPENLTQKETGKLVVYPNPATNELNIKLDNIQAEHVRIYNVDGKLISEIRQPSYNRIDVSNLNNGVYTAEVKVRSKMLRVRWVKM